MTSKERFRGLNWDLFFQLGLREEVGSDKDMLTENSFQLSGFLVHNFKFLKSFKSAFSSTHRRGWSALLGLKLFYFLWNFGLTFSTSSLRFDDIDTVSINCWLSGLGDLARNFKIVSDAVEGWWPFDWSWVLRLLRLGVGLLLAPLTVLLLLGVFLVRLLLAFRVWLLLSRVSLTFSFHLKQ